ncbi:hypothetical protein MIMGU_mgv1a013087mg [Erythranthe guttata]|uniref:Uncharacterized protein n=1 Tax=Erythranthe guttata TaxID=4155 RepID=A0A022S1S0_ERYGU|nr:hypothetical protein MIMGU_mgv1a013087mg [Erythranthe guttata]
MSAGTATDIGIDLGKFEDPPTKQDTNEKEGKDNANEVLSSKSNSADLPSTLTPDPAVRALSSPFSKSEHQSAGETGESIDKKEPDNHGLHSASVEESGMSESLCSKEDGNIIVSAKSPNTDEFPTSDNLPKGATDVVGLKQGSTVPSAEASFNQPDLGEAPPSIVQDIADRPAEQVPKGSAMDSEIGDKLAHTPQEQDANEKEGKDHTDEDLASKPNLADNFPALSCGIWK